MSEIIEDLEKRLVNTEINLAKKEAELAKSQAEIMLIESKYEQQIDTMERRFAINKSFDIGPNLAKAMSLAQGKIHNASKDRFNEIYKSSYATLSSVWDACREAMSESGVAIFQYIKRLDKPIEKPFMVWNLLCTKLVHGESGEFFEVDVEIREVGQQRREGPPVFNVQSYGSALTYAKRYSLAMAVGVASDDDNDDGNSASNTPTNTQQTPNKQQKPAQAPPIIPKFDFSTEPDLKITMEDCKPDNYLKSISFIRKDQTFLDLNPAQVDRLKGNLKSFIENVQQFNNAKQGN